MDNKLTVFLVLVMTFECNGHHSILGDILSNARERIHSGAEDVAGAVLGGLNFNLNFGLNRPQNMPQKEPGETIVVVVEEPSDYDYGNTNNNGPPPPPHHHHHHSKPPPHQHNRPPPHFDSDPPSPPHHHPRPPPHHDSNRPPPPHHHHQRPYGDPSDGYNNQNEGPLHPNEYEYSQNSNNHENSYGNNFNNNGYQPTPKGTERDQENNPKNPYESPNSNTFYDNLTTEYIKSPTKSTALPKNDETIKTTEKTSDDLPLFVPLGPNEYIYGGDKINITAPKRDTEKTKPTQSDDEDFAIDIRLKDE